MRRLFNRAARWTVLVLLVLALTWIATSWRRGSTIRGRRGECIIHAHHGALLVCWVRHAGIEDQLARANDSIPFPDQQSRTFVLAAYKRELQARARGVLKWEAADFQQPHWPGQSLPGTWWPSTTSNDPAISSGFVLPLWIPTAFIVALASTLWWPSLRARWARPAWACRACGYDRRGLNSYTRCPECGHPA